MVPQDDGECFLIRTCLRGKEGLDSVIEFEGANDSFDYLIEEERFDEEANECEFNFPLLGPVEFDAVATNNDSQSGGSCQDYMNELRQLFLRTGFTVNQGTAFLKYLAYRYPGNQYPRTWETFIHLGRR